MNYTICVTWRGRNKIEIASFASALSLDRTIIRRSGSLDIKISVVAIKGVTWGDSTLQINCGLKKITRWDSRSPTCRMTRSCYKRKTDYNGVWWINGVHNRRAIRFFFREQELHSEIYWDICRQVWRSGLSWILSSCMSTPVIQEELLDEVLMDVARFRAEAAINQPDVNRDAALRGSE